jgi:hypothetical protein
MRTYQIADPGSNVGAEKAAPTDRAGERDGLMDGVYLENGIDGCSELLHGLNNALASILLNAQVMGWKLPSYSRSKRYVHEIERNAQRSGEFVRRLLAKLEATCGVRLRDEGACADPVVLAAAECAIGTQVLDPVGLEGERGQQPARRSGPVCQPLRKATSHTTV